MNKKGKFKNWVKEHKAEIAVFTYGAVATGVGFALGYKRCGKQFDKSLKKLGSMMYMTSGATDYKLADLGKVGLDSLRVPTCPDYVNEDLAVNTVMFFYDKP